MSVTITPQSTYRAEIRVDGQFWGHANQDEHGGWEVFEGAFPHARRARGVDGCTLDEVQRLLEGSDDETPDYCECCLSYPCCCQWVIDRAAS